MAAPPWQNAPSHAALLTRRFLTDNNMTVVPHPPYYPDLALSDFFLFPKLKLKLKWRRFQTLEDIQTASQAVLNTLWEIDFQECFKNWQRRCDRCQASEGGLLWRWCRPLMPKLSLSVFKSSIRKLIDYHSYTVIKKMEPKEYETMWYKKKPYKQQTSYDL